MIKSQIGDRITDRRIFIQKDILYNIWQIIKYIYNQTDRKTNRR